MATTPASDLRAEAGVGLVSSLAGILVFLAFLLFAAQILVHLFTTSYVSAAAFDAARLASGSGSISAAAAQEHGANVLGMGDHATFDVQIGPDRVTVHVSARSPALLPRVFGQIIGVDAIERSVTVRREQPVCGDC